MKYAIRSILFLTFLYGSWFKLSSYFNNHNVAVVIEADGQLSDAARGVVKVYVQNLLKKTVNLPEIAHALRNSFAYVEDVAISKDPSHSFHVALTTTRPVALCNEQFAVCSNDRLFEKDVFAPTALASVPTYDIDRYKLASFNIKAFRQFVAATPSEVLSLYRITWHDPQKIYLQDKAHPAITLVANQSMMATLPTMHIAYTTVKNSLVERLQATPEKKRAKLAWLVDGRFKNQMVVIPKGVMA